MQRRMFLAGVPLLGYAASSPVAVIAHRGAHQRHPENSLAGIQAAAALGCDYVEVDVRTTRDGHAVLLHDAALGRMTDGSGNVEDRTLAEVRALELKGGGRIPLFTEALEALRPSRTGVYLDAKAIGAAEIRRLLQAQGMAERTVVYGSPALLQELAAVGTHPRVMPEARSVETLRALLDELRPRVVAFDRNDWRPEVIALARAAKVDLFVDRLGPEDTPRHWQEAIRAGATGIQTDHPAELLAILGRDSGR